MNNKQNHMKGRQRGRNGGGGGGGGGKPRPPGGGGGGRNPNYDGNNRPRGNAQQLMEKYLALARDASMGGDRVLAENYFQHADHYYRVLNARFEQNGQPRRDGQGQQPQQFERPGYHDRPFDSDQQPQHNPGGGYGGQPSQQNYQNQQPHQQAPTPAQEQNSAPEQQQSNEAEIALPPGVLPEAPALVAGSEPQEGGERQDGGGDVNRNRDRGPRRRGRGRGDRPFANAGE
jgi:hypothetical protein